MIIRVKDCSGHAVKIIKAKTRPFETTMYMLCFIYNVSVYNRLLYLKHQMFFFAVVEIADGFILCVYSFVCATNLFSVHEKPK